MAPPAAGVEVPSRPSNASAVGPDHRVSVPWDEGDDMLTLHARALAALPPSPAPV